MQEVDKATGETLGGSGLGHRLSPTSHFRAPCKRRHSIADDNLSVPKSAPNAKQLNQSSMYWILYLTPGSWINPTLAPLVALGVHDSRLKHTV